MNALDEIAVKIIQEQALVIGPLAWSEAGKVTGLHIVDSKKGEVDLGNTDPKAVVDRLVDQYERLFGRASHEVCRDAAASLIAGMSQNDVPLSLRV
jgi:hypothetical protein